MVICINYIHLYLAEVELACQGEHDGIDTVMTQHIVFLTAKNKTRIASISTSTRFILLKTNSLARIRW